ncbi:MAG: hypothetical protein RIE77_03185 [Phycisphaerales bacterium]
MPARVLTILLLACCLAGCATRQASTQPAAATFVVQAQDYGGAFKAAKGVLLDRHFELERVDARAGIIVTRPRSGAGLLTPWTLGPGSRPVEDTINAQRRVVEVRFEPAEETDRPPGGVPDALASPQPPLPPSQAAGAIVVSVRVLIERRVAPTRRLDASAIRIVSTPFDPRLSRRGLPMTYYAPRDLDADASAALARSVQRRLGTPQDAEG